MEVLVYYGVIKKLLWVILVICLVGVAVSVAQSINQVPMYRTTTTLMINPALPNPLLPYQGSASVEALAASYTHFLKTRSFAKLVADAIAPDGSAEQVLTSISGQLIPGTQFFKISAIASSPELAQKMANTTARVFIQENVAWQKTQREQTVAPRGQGTQISPDERRLLLHEMLEDELTFYQSQTATPP